MFNAAQKVASHFKRPVYNMKYRNLRSSIISQHEEKFLFLGRFLIKIITRSFAAFQEDSDNVTVRVIGGKQKTDEGAFPSGFVEISMRANAHFNPPM